MLSKIIALKSGTLVAEVHSDFHFYRQIAIDRKLTFLSFQLRSITKKFLIHHLTAILMCILGNITCFALSLTVTLLGFAPDCKCQNDVKKIDLQTFADIVQFDKSLAFDSSPLLGSDAAYDIRKYLQLNLNVYFSPNRQYTRTATSEFTTGTFMHQYQFNIKFQSQQRFFNLVTPLFMRTGASGIMFHPEKTSTDTDGESSLEFNPNSGHKSQLHFGDGFVQTLAQKLKLLFQYEVVLFHSEKFKVDGISTKKIMARNSIFGINFTYHF